MPGVRTEALWPPSSETCPLTDEHSQQTAQDSWARQWRAYQSARLSDDGTDASEFCVTLSHNYLFLFAAISNLRTAARKYQEVSHSTQIHQCWLLILLHLLILSLSLAAKHILKTTVTLKALGYFFSTFHKTSWFNVAHVITPRGGILRKDYFMRDTPSANGIHCPSKGVWSGDWFSLNLLPPIMWENRRETSALNLHFPVPIPVRNQCLFFVNHADCSIMD